eukprot:scaffold4827_cov109-Isochrysis_galbana.AAC.14
MEMEKTADATSLCRCWPFLFLALNPPRGRRRKSCLAARVSARSGRIGASVRAGCVGAVSLAPPLPCRISSIRSARGSARQRLAARPERR